MPIPSSLLLPLHYSVDRSGIAISQCSEYIRQLNRFASQQSIFRCKQASKSHAHRRACCASRTSSRLCFDQRGSTKQIPHPRLAFPLCLLCSSTAVKTILNIDHSAALRIQSASVHWTDPCPLQLPRSADFVRDKRDRSFKLDIGAKRKKQATGMHKVN